MEKQNLRDKMCENGFENSIAPIVLDNNPETEGYYDMVSADEYNIDEVDFKIEDKYKEFVEYYY